MADQQQQNDVRKQFLEMIQTQRNRAMEVENARYQKRLRDLSKYYDDLKAALDVLDKEYAVPEEPAKAQEDPKPEGA